MIELLKIITPYFRYFFWIVCILLVAAALFNRFSKSSKENFNKRDN